MQQVEDWLKKVGMSEYAQRFAENDIDFSILPELTDQDLEKIGVASLGHRRKILKAIAALSSTPAAAKPAAPAPDAFAALPTAAAARATPIAAADAAGERRYLTVMFCDLVGSTAISAQLDAEEWRDLVGAYLDAAAASVAELGGHVAKKLGDGLMCLFGYPIAHENDAERAARAALAIQRALANLNAKNAGSGKPELIARIGLESGPAVLDAAGEIFGDVANIAARVQALAEPGSIMVTARVQRQIAGLFVAEDCGVQPLKGVPEPTALFKVVRASGGGRRSGQRNLTPLIGRDDEMATLIRRWERARQGDGQLVLIVGEPGLGKSRLIEEFHSRLKETPHTWSEWSCSQLLQNTPLHPIAEWGRQRFGGPEIPAERRLADLESTLAQVKLDATENAALLAPLLDIALPKERTLTLAPEELRRRQLAAMTNWVIAGAKVQPIVLAFEDLHWADPTTLDVLRGIAERGAQVPLYIVATTRPEFRPPWGMRSHHGTISLAPLDRAQVRDMVAELSARHALSRDVVDDVAARTGGVPLFVEEVTRLLLERGEQGGAQAIPPTLQQSLMARLDRLGPAREVAQIGSVIGRGFSYKLLKAVAGMDDTPLEAALEKLSDADIVLVEGVVPESDYRFKHALIQDAAYENLLKSRRQVLHRRIAETLRDRFADKAAAEPEVLAHHFTQAGLTDAAIEWWGKAGDQALRRSAFQEAISHLGKAIEMADKESGAATPASASSSQRLKLQTTYGQAVMWSKGYGAVEATAAFARARELAKTTGSLADRFAAYYGQWANSGMHGGHRSVHEIAEIYLHEAETEHVAQEITTGRRMLGLSLHMQGDFSEAKAHLDEGLRVYDPQWSYEKKFGVSVEPGLTVMVYLASTEWLLGDAARARELVERAVARSVEAGHVPTLGSSYVFAAQLEALRHDANAAMRAGEAAAEYTHEHGLALYQSMARVYHGWALARLGNRQAGMVELERGLASHIEAGSKAWTPFFQGLYAEIEAEEGGSERGLNRLDKALALAADTGEYWTESFLHRVRGEILLKRDPVNPAPAEGAFLAAIAIAQQQKAKSFELQAALVLAKLYQSTGRAADAHAVLAPALEGFSPTPEFAEIAEAAAMLEAFAEHEDVKAESARRDRRLRLQVAYGNALISARGYAAPETAAALGRAQELAQFGGDTLARISAIYSDFLQAMAKRNARHAIDAAQNAMEATNGSENSLSRGIAHRMMGLALSYIGDFRAGKPHLEMALAMLEVERDADLVTRFNENPLIGVRTRSAFDAWVRGEADASEAHAAKAVAEAEALGHVATLCYVHGWKASLAALRRDPERALVSAEAALAASEHGGARVWVPAASIVRDWALHKRKGTEFGARLFEERLPALDEVGHDVLYRPLFACLAAEAGVEGGQSDGALKMMRDALDLSAKTGFAWLDAEARRVAGDILARRGDVEAAVTELTASLDLARSQGARAFELRAALSLAKLYQSIDRVAEAHAVLAPALEGFSPTPEFPEIAEAQALLATLAETDEVKNAAAARQRRLKLQNSYSQAVMWSKGYGAEETKVAFARATDLAATIGTFADRSITNYGRWANSHKRGDFALARETAEIFLSEAEKEGRMLEGSIGHRMLGLTCLLQGDLTASRAYLEEALKLYDPGRGLDDKFRLSLEPRLGATAYLAEAEWMLGDVERARHLINESVAGSIEAAHVPTLANTYSVRARYEIFRGDVSAALQVAKTSVEYSQEHQLGHYLPMARVHFGWARAQLGEPKPAILEMRQAVATHNEHGNKAWMPFLLGLIADVEAVVEDADVALVRIDEALALAAETGEHWTDSFSHRIRGEILLKRDSVNTGLAEEAFLSAIAIAQQQKAKSFELQAALPLARLYQNTNRAADAHAVLAPALEGFTPTPEFPEIEAAQALLAALS